MAASVAKKDDTFLTLGWQVTPTLEPRYWLDGDAKPGLQQESDLVRVRAADSGSHTAIIAQSGSGKSFFLGRLIEELILNTKARCLILDPNADFRQIQNVEKESLWNDEAKDEAKKASKPKYDLITRMGKLPHEASQKEFKDLWPTDDILIKTGIGQQGDNYQQLKLWWPSVAVDFFAGNADPLLRSQLYYCHSFVQALATLVAFKAKATGKKIDLIATAEDLLSKSRKLRSGFRSKLEEEFAAEKLATQPSEKGLRATGLGLLSFGSRTWERLVVDFAISSATQAPKYITEEGQRFYFGTVNEYQKAGILETDSERRSLTASRLKRVEVIDLPALQSKATQLLAINAILKTEWDLARNDWSTALGQAEEKDTRVPTFIVVDEAHNLIPVEPSGRAEIALREQFRTIIAEGRKYGLFLILVSQRPDKLDPLVVSECENKVIMKLSSRAVLDKTRQMLGLEDVPSKLLDRCLEFELGRALLIGNWTPTGPQFMYSAPRRTVEGGRNLRKKYWAVPPDARPQKKPKA